MASITLSRSHRMQLLWKSRGFSQCLYDYKGKGYTIWQLRTQGSRLGPVFSRPKSTTAFKTLHKLHHLSCSLLICKMGIIQFMVLVH